MDLKRLTTCKVVGLILGLILGIIIWILDGGWIPMVVLALVGTLIGAVYHYVTRTRNDPPADFPPKPPAP